jgi:hypothetical protein
VTACIARPNIPAEQQTIADGRQKYSSRKWSSRFISAGGIEWLYSPT